MNYIVTKPLKNKGLAVFLVVIFGSLGLFYSSIIGGIIMTIFYPILLIVLFFWQQYSLLIFLCCLYYVICIIWAINGINHYNRHVEKYASQYSSQYQQAENTGHSVETYESPYSYYKVKDNSHIWLLLTIAVLFAIVGGYLYYFKN
jgi:Ca2+/Na+ antiporter